jgi:protein TonB
VIRQRKPHYTVEAMADRTQGVVWVDAVVKTDGTVGNVCVTKPLHPDLDAEALAAARQWLFKPGTRDGTAVNVLVTIELSFTLK